LDSDDFPRLVQELEYFLQDSGVNQRVRAVPSAAGANIPIWLLGSSGGFSAELAGRLGLPFSFAAHFSPENLEAALRIYRGPFRPSAGLKEPYVMVALNVFAADTDAEAERISTSQQQSFINLLRGTPAKIQPPVDNIAFVESTKADELIVHGLIYDHAARLRSYEIVATALMSDAAGSAAGK
jgi:luciferase family oxidoreductase group 1